jgi:sec-independent protein translocase protein TatC
MSQDYERPDPEDLFAHTRMSLGDHIEELRTCLIRAGKGFLIALIVGFFVAERVLAFIRYPIERQLQDFHKERIKEVTKKLMEDEKDVEPPIIGSVTLNLQELAEKEGWPVPKSPSINLTVRADRAQFYENVARLQMEADERGRLVSFTITEPFIVWCKVSIYVGLVLASPWIFYQVWSFVAAGLYPHEKKYVWIFMPFCLLLFLGGVALCQFVVLPKGIEYLLYFYKWLNIEPELRLNDWLSFAILMPIIMGLAFQLPLLMYGLYKIGVFDVETYVSHWRIALFVMTLLGFFLAPSPDPFSGLCMAGPLWLLYFVGIWLCKMWPNPKFEMEEADEEAVEV